MAPAIYLAGPEVFHPDAVAIGEAKKRICERYGFVGLYPLDSDDGQAPAVTADAILRRCLTMLRRADLLVANLTPFRGVSADVGTVFELGYAHALGTPVFGYSNVRADLRTRVGNADGPLQQLTDGAVLAADGLTVEDFGLADNLMIAECLRSLGRDVVLPETDDLDWTDLGAFERCMEEVARLAPPPASRSATFP